MRRFGYGKVRYRGLAKERIALLLGFSNLLIAGRGNVQGELQLTT